jgi:hypothetical protein
VDRSGCLPAPHVSLNALPYPLLPARLEPPESFRPETGHQGFFSTQLPIRVSSLGAETRHSDQFAAFYKSERFLMIKIAPGRPTSLYLAMSFAHGAPGSSSARAA